MSIQCNTHANVLAAQLSNNPRPVGLAFRAALALQKKCANPKP